MTSTVQNVRVATVVGLGWYSPASDSRSLIGRLSLEWDRPDEVGLQVSQAQAGGRAGKRGILADVLVIPVRIGQAMVGQDRGVGHVCLGDPDER